MEIYFQRETAQLKGITNYIKQLIFTLKYNFSKSIKE